MSKSSELSGFKGLYSNLILDSCRFLSLNHREMARDLKRVLSLVDNRGFGFLAITLPEAGKILDQALSSGRLPRLSLPGFRATSRKSGAIIPRLFSGIWTRIFTEDGVLREDACITSVYVLRQLLYCFKKYDEECDDRFSVTAIQDFLRIESELNAPTLDWSGDHFNGRHLSAVRLSDGQQLESNDSNSNVAEGASADLLDYVQQCCDVVAASFGCFYPLDWKPKHGPGAVSDLSVGKESKYSFPTWSPRLECVFPLAEFAFANYGDWAHWVSGAGYSAVALRACAMPSRLIMVPKTLKGPRLIASEPVSAQWCQQAILDFIVNTLPKTPVSRAVDFRSQQRNRDLALEASRTGSKATIDLSSASDRVSCWLVERFFRRNLSLLEALFASRTPSVSIQLYRWNEILTLKKFSMMGAATTFPIQSIIFSTACAAVWMWKRRKAVSLASLNEAMSHVRVFGDDLIVDTDTVTDVIDVLTALGLSVNRSKTFTEGNFRESCGWDAFKGELVTPTYIRSVYDKSRPTSLASVVEVSNNLHKAGWWGTADAILRTLPRNFARNMAVDIVDLESSKNTTSRIFGLQSFCGKKTDHLKQRYNRDLHRSEYKSYRVTSKAPRRDAEETSRLLQYFLEAPDFSRIVSWEGGYAERSRQIISAGWDPTPPP